VLSTKLIGRAKNFGIKDSHVRKTRKRSKYYEPVPDEGFENLQGDGCRDVSAV
jgi:hypothetical protein